MSIEIPFHPAFVLGGLISEESLKALENINSIVEPVITSRDQLDDCIKNFSSFESTIRELKDLNAYPETGSKEEKQFIDAKNSLEKEIVDSAKLWANSEIKSQSELNKAKKNLEDTIKKDKVKHIESPLDYGQSQFISQPLSFDSFNLNVQYYSWEDNEQQSQSNFNKIRSFIAGSSNSPFFKSQFSLTNSVMNQINEQKEKHDIQGTVIIMVRCTHKNAKVLSPFILNPDKAVNAWNLIYPNDRFAPYNLKSYQDILKNDNKSKGISKTLNIISGATTGSTFIGLINLKNMSKTKTKQEVSDIVSKLQAQVEIGNWFTHKTGGFGLDANIANSLKSLISTQYYNSHVNIFTQGVIPKITANSLQFAVKEMSDFSPSTMGEQLAQLANTNNDESQGLDESAKQAIAGGEMLAVRSNEISSVLTAVAKEDVRENSVIDQNSLIQSLNDYIEQTSGEDIGVPINYYLKSLTKTDIARVFLSKYDPSFDKGTFDDKGNA